MKTSLFPLLFLVLHLQVNAQATLYQQGTEIVFQDALELYTKGQFPASKIEFARLEEANLSENREIERTYYYASAALRAENPDGAVLLEKFILEYPAAPLRNTAAMELGDHFFLARNYSKAIESFRKVDLGAVYGEEKAAVLFKSGYSFFQLKNYKESLSYFEQAKLFRSEYLPDAYYYAAYVHLVQKDDEKAIQNFKEAEKASTYAGKVPYMLASIFYRQKDFDALIAYAPSILQRQGLEKKEAIQLLLAEAYYEKGNHEQAAQNYMAFVQSKKGTLTREQQYKAGVSHYQTNRFVEASNFFKEVALQNDKLGQVSSYYLGHAYVKLNNPQFASNSFSNAYKSDHDLQIKQEALFNYAKVNLEKGSFQDAVNALDTYLNSYATGPHAKEAENLLSDALINTNNYLRAIEHMDKMANKSDRIKGAYQKVTFYQAMVYYRDNKYPAALQLLNKSQTYPVDRNLLVQSQFWKGEIHAVNGNLPEAIKAYEAVIALKPSPQDPHLLKTHYGLGYAYFNSENYPKAEVQFKVYTDKLRGSREKENYEDALLRLGDTYYVQKKFGDALETFNRAIRENNASTDYAHFRAGVIHNFENRNSQAIDQLDRIINGFPTSRYLEDALFQKAQINMEMTRYSEARDGFSALISSRPNSPFIPFALEGRAVANYSLQQYEGAIMDYKRILDNHPNSSNVDAALVGLQESLTLQGRAGEFSNYLSTYKKTNPGSNSLQVLEFENAKNLFFSQSFEASIRAFESYLRSYPNVPQSAEARFFIGDAHLRLNAKDKALEYFYQLEKVSDASIRNRAIQRIATLEFEKGNYQKSIPYFRSSGKNARTKIEEYEAYNGLMESFFAINSYDSAIYYSDKVMQLGGVTPDALPKSMLIKGKSLKAAGRLDQAKGTFMTLYKDFKTVHGAEGLYLLALILHDAGQFKESNDLIFDHSQDFGPYDFWYGKQFILLAKNYLKLNEAFQAKATLESVVENSSNELVKEEANQLLRSIN
jgi:tetratricopeptide (TPR) repeat protein